MTRNYYTQLLVTGAVCFLLAAGCKKDTPETPPVSITATPQTLELAATGGTHTITVTVTNATDWLALSDAGWLTVTKETATSVKVEAAVNTGAARNATVRCTAGTVTSTVTVSQSQLVALQRDSLALVDLYNATAGAGWTTKWTLSVPLSQWQGVTVENGRVTELNLPSNNLTGGLPGSIGDLTALTYCHLSKNHLSGAAPATLGNLTQLVFLDLSENALSGALPPLNTLLKLVVLDVSFNSITALPPLNSLTALEYLAFSKNNLSGDLPANWSSLVKLIYIDGSFNSFSGALPNTWSAFGNMQAFYFYNNTLNGNLPRYLGDFSKLKTLALDGNNLTGAVPDNLGAQPALDSLWLAQNQLSGAIPASLLDNAHWNTWRNDVCPQQSGYGFDNCTGVEPAPGSLSLSKATQRLSYKEKYRRIGSLK